MTINSYIFPQVQDSIQISNWEKVANLTADAVNTGVYSKICNSIYSPVVNCMRISVSDTITYFIHAYDSW